MKKRGIQILTAALSALLVLQSPGVSGLFNENPVVAYADVNRPATVGATTLNVRSGAGTNNSIVCKLSYGASVTVVGEKKDSSGTNWYKIRFTSGSVTKEGYASSEYIKFPVSYTQDTSFESYLDQQGFPESYKDSLRTLHTEHPTWIFKAQKTNLNWNDVIENESSVGANLVGTSSISSWKSTDYGAYDWNTGKWTGFDGAAWVSASKEIVSYYMDPRNFLNDTYVFQFLTNTYDSEHQNKEGLESLISGTFLDAEAVNHTTGGSGPSHSVNGPGSQGSSGPGSSSGSTSSDELQAITPGSSGKGEVKFEGPPIVNGASVTPKKTSVLAVPTVEYGPGMDMSSISGDTTGASSTSPIPEGQTYAEIIMKAAKKSGVNPYVIGAMILQEQGNGTSGSISGKTSGYEGYYNFFNVGAYQAGSMSAIVRGLWYASQSGNYGRPWNTIEKSIVGGAQYYGENYVQQGQDTFYLKKFNVQGSNLYKHQYMTNVEAAAGEGAKLARAYTDTMKNQTLVFKIPVYNDMPETACAKPNGTGSPNNKLSDLNVTGYALTPTFSMDTDRYDIIVNPSVDRIAVNASAIDSKATISGAGTISLQSGKNTIDVNVTAENGTVRTYKLNVIRQSNAPAVNVPSGSASGPGAGLGSSSGPGSTGSAGPGSSSSASQGPGGSGSQNSSQGSGHKVVIGVAPGYQSDVTNIPSGAPQGAGSQQSVPVTPETQAPAPTQASETQAPAPTKAPETQAPAATKPAETAPQQSSTRSKGDCNGDGKITILDVMLIRKHVLGQNVLNGEAKTAADINGDGSITSADATALQKKIFGQ